MQQINQYTILKKLSTFNENIKLWYCENSEGSNYEVLTIAKDENYQRLLDRTLKGQLKPLVGIGIDAIQKIIEVGFDTNNDCYFIVYADLEDYAYLSNCPQFATVQSILDIVRALAKLSNQGKEMFYIHPMGSVRVNSKGNAVLCFVGLFELFSKQNLVDRTFLAPNVVDWLEDSKQQRPNFQDDIYSLIKCFEGVLRANLIEEAAAQVLSIGLKERRIERFAKHYELIELLEHLPVKRVQDEELRAIKVVSTIEKSMLEQVLKEMNNNVWLLVDSQRSKKDNAIRGDFTTENWSGKFIVDKKHHLFIPHCNNTKEERMLKNKDSFVANFSFTTYASNYRCAEFFEAKFAEQNQLAQLNKQKNNSVKQWKVLPEKEKEFIEESAFKAKYEKLESIVESSNFKFYLTDVDNKGWQELKKLKTDKVELFVGDQRIGIILDYNTGQQTLIIRDPNCSIDELPEKGELIQDVRQETSQFKKQIEACSKFEKSDVVNPLLCSILATPEKTTMPNTANILEDDYEGFKELVFNKDLENDLTQQEAVLEALHRKPVYLIQGPPGTGKTTVIVELIRQILNRQKEAKILVSSQSNLAVDNVLEKLDWINQNEKNHLRFMRLASEQSLEKENITNTILPHTFENKLKNWVTETEKRSKEYLYSKYDEQQKKKDLINLYKHLNEGDWDKFLFWLKASKHYIQLLFDKANNKADARIIFEQELGAKFLKLQQLQSDWFAFLGGVMVDDGKDRKKSMLNDGSAEIDFLIAMMRDVNIIGATCIHIASGAYSKINFRFDYVIMDESSKASPPETLVPINMGQNIILIGDHRQLPPVITREDAVKKKVKTELEDNGLDFNKDFGVSLFEQLVEAFEKDESKEQYIKMLDIQYRMPKQVGDLISKYFYEGKLNNPATTVLPNYDQDHHHGLAFKKETSIVFISTSNRENPSDNGDKYNRQNACNVDAIKEILSELNDLYKDNLNKEKPLTIGVIAGYRGQVNLLQQKIQPSTYKNFVLETMDSSSTPKKENLISINTVDKFQGAERDIIIYDVVRSSIGQSNIGFLDDYRRINVAFSRVKRLLIVVGDNEYLTKRATLNQGGQFTEFKLQQIAQELKNNGFVFNNLKELVG